MSGMEPLAALGLASNVLQMISFCHESARLYNSLKEKGAADPGLDGNTKKMVDVTTNLRISMNQAAKQPMTSDQKALYNMATAVLDTGTTLSNELKKLQVDLINSSKWESLRKLFKSMRNRDKISRLEKDMKRCSETLSMGLLVRIWFVSRMLLGRLFC